MLIRTRDMPHALDERGRRTVDVAEGAAWLRNYLVNRRKSRIYTTEEKTIPQGTFLRWDRGRGRGYAYSIVVDSDEVLTTLQMDYAAEQSTVSTERLLDDIKHRRHDTCIVQKYEVLRFLANQLHRAHWAVTLTEFDDDEAILKQLAGLRERLLQCTKQH